MPAGLDPEPPELLPTASDVDRQLLGLGGTDAAEIAPSTSTVTAAACDVVPPATGVPGGMNGSAGPGFILRDRRYVRANAAWTVPRTSASGTVTGSRFGITAACATRPSQYHCAILSCDPSDLPPGGATTGAGR